MHRRFLSLLVLVPAAFATLLHAQQPDKYIYLEDPTGDRAMSWVKAENARTAKVLEADPRFAAYEADALKVAEDPNRLAIPMLRGDEVYNFWRDAAHVRGIYRKTSLSSYLTPPRSGIPSSMSTHSADRIISAGSVTDSPASIPATASASPSFPLAAKMPTRFASST